MTTDTAEGAGKRASIGELTSLEAELLAALRWIAEIADKTYEQDHKLRADAARNFMRISDKARTAISKAEAVAAEK